MDLFVNGTSIATGIGSGGEKFKGFGDGDITTSWVHFLANKLNCDRLWNHSFPSKPMSFTIADTMGFCEQYYERYGTYDNLFAIIEWSLPKAHGKWPPVVSNSPLYKDRVILPVVISEPGTPDVYKTMYMCKPDKVDYLLPNKPLYDLVHWRYIDEMSKQKHESQRDQYYHRFYNLSKRIVEAQQEIIYTKQWLKQRNIKYMMFWAFGVGSKQGIRKMISSAMPEVEKDPRFISIKDFSALDYGAKYSLKLYNSHPDIHGQKHISEYLYNYIICHQLLPKVA